MADAPPPSAPLSPTATREDDAPRPIGNLRMVWDFARGYPGRIAIAMFALATAAGATLAIPAGLKRIVDDGFEGGSSDIAPYFHYLFMIVGVLALATAIRFYFVSWIGERVVADIREAVQRNLLRLAPAFFEENRPSEISSRMTSDTTIIEQVVGTTLSVALRNIVMGIGGVAYLFTLAPKLTGMMLLGIPLVIVPIVFLGRKVRTISRDSQDRVADVGSMASEVLGAMKIVQAFGQEEREATRFAGAVEATFTTAKRRILIRALMTAIVIGLIFGAITSLMWYGATEVRAGHISGGTILAFLFTGIIVAGAFGALTEVYGDLLRGSGAAGRLGDLLSEQPAIAPPTHPTPLPEPAQGQLSFDAVTFRYPTRPEVAALDDFSLDVRPNERLAVVGPSGAGKTTLFQLIQRFYDPQAGELRLDGVPLTAADPADIRGRIAMVPQETVIFAASARDNLRYGNWAATDDDLWEAARAANAEGFLRALPQGLDTFMGEGGARLSGGQRQRLAIARALLRKAPLLLLDEATSALDAESEAKVQDALDHLMEGRTTIVIAHRLATVRAADRIVVMDAGRIVEQGDHDTLIAKNGLYARLARLQFES
ncbi:ATP-binding cassette domain-containing protein [Sphingorhabdus soli]|uniref:ATP-binding cassette domain-containing protein n=1 Tax=Flavisphingopyxis soli TaxID=2601267 RepID=A0A5C6U626_9SPHN|nr:ABC transporter transmembrane domain-containing protein [Sphingorhabdus soli]TXC68199.1 ATP-binding cassette domain-containing protein [Sphingorhabdus soli]